MLWPAATSENITGMPNNANMISGVFMKGNYHEPPENNELETAGNEKEYEIKKRRAPYDLGRRELDTNQRDAHDSITRIFFLHALILFSRQ